MYYLDAGNNNHNRMRNAVLLAAALHCAMVLGISFEASSSDYHSRQIEVTLATRPGDTLPEEALHVAQHNQQGSGEQADKAEVTTRHNALPTGAQSTLQTLLPHSDSRTAPREDLLTSNASAQRKVNIDQAERARKRKHLHGISDEVDQLNQQLASLEAELDEQTRTYAEMPRVRRLTAVSARQAVDAAYLLDWRQRVEAVGNKYYPEASVRYGIYGDLRLLVVILQDGSLEDIRVLSSSGYAVLDEAAIKIVRMAAPYSPFPAELKATTDKLEIIRTWQFQENQLSSN